MAWKEDEGYKAKHLWKYFKVDLMDRSPHSRRIPTSRLKERHVFVNDTLQVAPQCAVGDETQKPVALTAIVRPKPSRSPACSPNPSRSPSGSRRPSRSPSCSFCPLKQPNAINASPVEEEEVEGEEDEREESEDEEEADADPQKAKSGKDDELFAEEEEKEDEEDEAEQQPKQPPIPCQDKEAPDTLQAMVLLAEDVSKLPDPLQHRADVRAATKRMPAAAAKKRLSQAGAWDGENWDGDWAQNWDGENRDGDAIKDKRKQKKAKIVRD